MENQRGLHRKLEIPENWYQRLQTNEAVAKKFNNIEIRILSTLNFHDFFERLLSEISNQFQVPYIWLTIIKESALARQLQTGDMPQWLVKSSAFVPEKLFLSIVPNALAPMLANKNLDRFRSLIPEGTPPHFGSIAIAPLSLDGEIVGSLNQADTADLRFKPGIDTSLLEQLALKISLCLSNVAAHEQLKFFAYHDPLTGLLNRRVMQRILDREFRRAVRYHTDLSIIFFDLDAFKTINDTAGHDAGDKALCLTARALDRVKRDSDIIARYAGDEFVAILPSTNQLQAEQYILRVTMELERHPLILEKARFTIKMSHGISSISDPGITDIDSLLKAADTRLYQEKEKRKYRP